MNNISNEVIPLCIDSIYSLYYIVVLTEIYIIKWIYMNNMFVKSDPCLLAEW